MKQRSKEKLASLCAIYIVSTMMLGLLVMVPGVRAETSGNLGDVAGWYNDGVATTSAYLSGNNVYDFDRIAVVKYDLSSIPAGSTIDSVVAHLYCDYSTVSSGNLRGYQSPYLSGTSYSYGHAFTDGEIDTNAPSGTYQLSGAVWAESSWGSISGAATAWQDEFDAHESMTIGYSGWGYAGTSQSLGIQITTSYVVVTYTSVGTWAPHFDSTPDTAQDINVEYDYEVVINETSDFEIINMPSWLTCEDNNTEIDSTHLIGTPTSVGTYHVHLHATSVAGTETANQEFDIVVTDPDSQITGSIYPDAIIWKDGGTDHAYISGHDDPWAYGRFIFMKFDLTSIDAGATLTDIALTIYTGSSNYPIAVNATGAFAGNGSGYSFSAAQLASLSPAGSRAFQIDGDNNGNGMIATWQTQFDDNGTLYIGLSAWDWAGTGTSDLIATFLNDGQERTPYIVVTYSGTSTPPSPTPWAPTITSGAAADHGWMGVPYTYQGSANESVNWTVTSTYGVTGTSLVYLDTSADITGNAGIVKHGAATYWECANWYNSGAYWLTKSGTSANAQFEFDDLFGYLGTINSVGGVWVYAQAYVNTGSGWEWVDQAVYYANNPTTNTAWDEASVNSISGYFKSSPVWSYQLNGIYVGATQVTPFLDQGATNGLRGMYLAVEVSHTNAIPIATVTTGGLVSLVPPSAGTYAVSLKAESVAGTLYAWYNWTVTIRDQWAPTLENSPDDTGLVGVAYTFYYQYNESINQIFVEADWNAAGTWDVSIGYGMDLSGSYISFTPAHGGVYSIKLQAWSFDGLGDGVTLWDVTVPVAWNPSVTSSPITSGYEGFVWSYHITFNETCTFVNASLPAWVAYNAGTQTFSGTSLVNGTWSFSATFVSTVEYGTVTQYWNVTLLNRPHPVFTSTPVVTVVSTSTYRYTVSTTGNSTFALSEAPSWMTLNGQLVKGASTVGHWHVIIKATDTFWGTSTYQVYDVTATPLSPYGSDMNDGVWALIIPFAILMITVMLCSVSREGVSGALFMGTSSITLFVLAWRGAFGDLALPMIAIGALIMAIMLFRAYREGV